MLSQEIETITIDSEIFYMKKHQLKVYKVGKRKYIKEFISLSTLHKHTKSSKKKCIIQKCGILLFTYLTNQNIVKHKFLR